MTDGVLFIGLGRMGGPMALRLAEAGVKLAVADLSAEAIAPFIARGVPAATEPARLEGDTVITMLPSDREVAAALLGPGGACTVPGRQLVVDMSSASPDGTRSLATALASLGITLLDAPVSGGMAGARDGTLTCMVGGDAEAFAACRALLAAMCRDVVRVGPVGSGHVVKALNNYLSAATLWTASEALVIGRRLGLDPAAMLAVWTAGSGRSHATEVKLPRHVLSGRYDFGQSLALFCKDIGIAAELAEAADAGTPLLDAVRRNWEDLRDRLGGQDDITAVARDLTERHRRES